MAVPQRIEGVANIESTMGDREFTFIAERVYEFAGIVLGPAKRNMVVARLVRRVRDLGLTSFPDYCARLKGPEAESEFGHLINAITTNLTRFFREDHHFEYLAAKAVPEIVARAKASGRRRLRIWSAGCSSGEEPYSIAITLMRAMPDLDQWDARILATDLDTNMVARGASGLYPREAVTSLPAQYRNGAFEPVPGQPEMMRVIEPLRRRIAFKKLNLLGAWPMKGPFDAIFCRNVMIYFDGPTKRDLVNRYAELICPNGHLFVGHSETLLDLPPELTLTGRTIYRRQA